MLSTCQKADGNCFLGQKGSAKGGINATKDHNNVRSVLRKTNKKLIRAMLKKRRGMLTYDVVLLHDNACPHTQTAACNQAMLEHFNWELFDHHHYSPDLTLRDYHLFIYLRFDNNKELMEGVKT
jgi:hypothetical protein